MTDTTNPTQTITVERAETTVITPQPAAVVRNATGVLSTATNSTGGMVTRDLTPNDRVTVMGCEMTLAQAEQKGFITRGPDGRYQDASEEEVSRRVAQRITPEQPKEDLSEALEVDAVHTDTLANWAGAVRGIGANPAAVLGEVVLNPDKVPEALSLLARQHGISQARIQADIQAISASVEDGINRYVSAAGVRDTDKFWEWVHGTVQKQELVVAVNRALFEGNASSFKALAGRFLRTSGAYTSDPGSQPKSVKVRVGSTVIETDPVTARRNGWL